MGKNSNEKSKSLRMKIKRTTIRGFATERKHDGETSKKLRVMSVKSMIK